MSARILVVDDTAANVKVLTDVLSSAGYHVTACASGTDGLARITSSPPDLVLLDVVMPGLSGYEVCRQIRANPTTALLPVLMVTSLDPRRERVAGIEAGADDFLSRPFHPPELLARVRSLLRIKALQDATIRQAEALADWNAKFEARVGEHIDGVSADAPVPDRMLLEKLMQLGVVRSFPANMVIVNEADASDSFYVIVSGRVKLFVSDEEGREMVLGEQGPGEFFGEIALDGNPRVSSVSTLEPSKVAVIPGAELRRLCAGHAPMAMMIMRRLIGRVRQLTQSVKKLALVDVYGRVASLLLELAREEGGQMVIEPRPTQQDMAIRVGASREMISRILKDLAAGGYIRVEGQRMIIDRQPPRAW
jgi:CRP/FNR family transcriptional regulator, cyclic AMP receptor protein